MSSRNAMEELLLHGTIFSIRLSMPSGRKKLDWRKLGIETVNNPELITDGQIWIAPKERMNEMTAFRSRAQSVLDQNGIKLSFGYIIPRTKREFVLEKLQEIRVEFQEAARKLSQDYPALKQDLLNKWNQEAVSISVKTGNQDQVFKIMDAVEKMFPSWEEFWYGDIAWIEIDELQKMAQQFVYEATSGIMQKMHEFADSLKKRIEENNLTSRNMQPILKWIEQVRESVAIFGSEQLNEMMNDLEAVVSSDGNDLRVSQRLRDTLSRTLDGISEAASEHVDEVARESIARLTSQKRILDK